MKSSVRVCLGFVVASAALAFVGCGDDDTAEPAAGGSPAHGGAEAHGGAVGHGGAVAHGGAVGHGGEAEHGEGAILCEVIGELCHEADTGSGPAHECHEVGHVGNAAGCAEAFDGCIALCTGDDEGTGGAGGSGTAPDAHCAALGELCHGVDDGDGPLHDCHEVGHVGNAAGCAEAFDDCATQCLAAHEALEEAAGGAGGVSSTGGASHSSDAGGNGGHGK